MRLGVLDVGSNTVHLLLVEAHRGAHPWPAYSEKTVLRLAERIRTDGRLAEDAADELVKAAASAREAAQRNDAVDMLAFATSAVRDPPTRPRCWRVREETGVELEVLTGQAKRGRRSSPCVAGSAGRLEGRWCLTSAGDHWRSQPGRMNADIAPRPLGAGRLTRERLSADPPPAIEVDDLRQFINRQLESIEVGDWDRAAATSKTFRTLARLAGAAPSSAGFRAPRSLSRTGVHQVFGFIQRMASTALAEMDGVSAARAHQLLAGALIAEAAMRRLGVEQVDICPWALREGVILRRLDTIANA
jgi:exopolyphosphatase/guanosine-5'-triphosphate,3'-diphosphate pyrophosphatase